MTEILPQDAIYYNVAKNEGKKYYMSKTQKLIFADCNCEKYIQKCYDNSCHVQSTQRTDGCVTEAVPFSDLKEISKDVFFEKWDNSPKLQINPLQYFCLNC